MTNKQIYMSHSFVNIPELKCSFFILQNKDNIDEETILIKLDDGKYKDMVLSVSNFIFSNDSTSELTFEYHVVHNPNSKDTSTKTFESVVRSVVRKIITYAIKNAKDNEKTVEKKKISNKAT